MSIFNRALTRDPFSKIRILLKMKNSGPFSIWENYFQRSFIPTSNFEFKSSISVPKQFLHKAYQSLELTLNLLQIGNIIFLLLFFLLLFIIFLLLLSPFNSIYSPNVLITKKISSFLPRCPLSWVNFLSLFFGLF